MRQGSCRSLNNEMKNKRTVSQRNILVIYTNVRKTRYP